MANDSNLSVGVSADEVALPGNDANIPRKPADMATAAVAAPITDTTLIKDQTVISAEAIEVAQTQANAIVGPVAAPQPPQEIATIPVDENEPSKLLSTSEANEQDQPRTESSGDTHRPESRQRTRRSQKSGGTSMESAAKAPLDRADGTADTTINSVEQDTVIPSLPPKRKASRRRSNKAKDSNIQPHQRINQVDDKIPEPPIELDPEEIALKERIKQFGNDIRAVSVSNQMQEQMNSSESEVVATRSRRLSADAPAFISSTVTDPPMLPLIAATALPATAVQAPEFVPTSTGGGVETIAQVATDEASTVEQTSSQQPTTKRKSMTAIDLMNSLTANMKATTQPQESDVIDSAQQQGRPEGDSPGPDAPIGDDISQRAVPMAESGPAPTDIRTTAVDAELVETSNGAAVIQQSTAASESQVVVDPDSLRSQTESVLPSSRPQIKDRIKKFNSNRSEPLPSHTPPLKVLGLQGESTMLLQDRIRLFNQPATDSGLIQTKTKAAEAKKLIRMKPVETTSQDVAPTVAGANDIKAEPVAEISPALIGPGDAKAEPVAEISPAVIGPGDVKVKPAAEISPVDVSSQQADMVSLESVSLSMGQEVLGSPCPSMQLVKKPSPESNDRGGSSLGRSRAQAPSTRTTGPSGAEPIEESDEADVKQPVVGTPVTSTIKARTEEHLERALQARISSGAIRKPAPVPFKSADAPPPLSGSVALDRPAGPHKRLPSNPPTLSIPDNLAKIARPDTPIPEVDNGSGILAAPETQKQGAERSKPCCNCVVI